MNQTEVTSRPDIDIRLQPRARLTEDGSELDGCRAVAVGDRVRQKGSAQVVTDEARYKGERLRGSLESPVRTQAGTTHEERGQRRQDGNRCHGTAHGLHGFTHPEPVKEYHAEFAR